MTDSADVLTNVCTAFYSLFTALTDGAHNDFYNAVNGQLYEDEAPSGAAYPYAVYQIIAAPKDKTFSEEYTDLLIQLSIFSNSTSSAEIKDAYYHAHNLYDDKTMTITGSKLVWMKETNLVTMTEEVETPEGISKVKHYAMDIEIKTSLD